MGLDRVAAVRKERDDVVAFCRDLTPDQWSTPSQCDGWTVHDVLAHLTAIAHGVFGPWMLKFMTAKDLERSNDADVEARRATSPDQLLAEYDKWSKRMVKLLAVGQRPPLSKAPFKVGELGVFPMAQVASASVFDTHLHLHHDMATALGKTLPAPGANTIAVMNEWALGVTAKLFKDPLSFMDRPVTITLDGPGGGSWTLVPATASNGTGAGKPATVHPAASAPSVGVATINANPAEFTLWATRRRPWREHDVKITGDEPYATRFLDALRVV